MKPLTTYKPYIGHDRVFGDPEAEMRRDSYGRWYAKDEADAVIRELEAASLEMTKAARHLMQQRDDAWAERDRLEAERDAARADAERLRADADRAARFSRWLVSGDTGLSSESIAMHMLGWACRGHYPHDPSDLGRCLRMLAIFPEWQGRIGEMATYGPEWAEIARRWPELSALMAGEVGIGWEKGRSAPITYAAMRAAIDAARSKP